MSPKLSGTEDQNVSSVTEKLLFRSADELHDAMNKSQNMFFDINTRESLTETTTIDQCIEQLTESIEQVARLRERFLSILKQASDEEIKMVACWLGYGQDMERFYALGENFRESTMWALGKLDEKRAA